MSGSSVPELIVKFLQAPLVGGFQSLPGILLYVLLSTFVFVLGIHGAYVFGAISGPVLLTSLQQNIDAIQAGHTALILSLNLSLMPMSIWAVVEQ